MVCAQRVRFASGLVRLHAFTIWLLGSTGRKDGRRRCLRPAEAHDEVDEVVRALRIGVNFYAIFCSSCASGSPAVFNKRINSLTTSTSSTSNSHSSRSGASPKVASAGSRLFVLEFNDELPFWYGWDWRSGPHICMKTFSIIQDIVCAKSLHSILHFGRDRYQRHSCLKPGFCPVSSHQYAARRGVVLRPLLSRVISSDLRIRRFRRWPALLSVGAKKRENRGRAR